MCLTSLLDVDWPLCFVPGHGAHDPQSKDARACYQYNGNQHGMVVSLADTPVCVTDNGVLSDSCTYKNRSAVGETEYSGQIDDSGDGTQICSAWVGSR